MEDHRDGEFPHPFPYQKNFPPAKKHTGVIRPMICLWREGTCPGGLTSPAGVAANSRRSPQLVRNWSSFARETEGGELSCGHGAKIDRSTHFSKAWRGRQSSFRTPHTPATAHTPSLVSLIFSFSPLIRFSDCGQASRGNNQYRGIV